MAVHVKKIPFPDFLLTTDCIIKIDDVGISEEGEPLTGTSIEAKCIFSEKTKRIIDPDGTRVDLIGKIIFKGDIAPAIAKIKTGKVLIGNKSMNIYSCNRPRNPDGTVYSTNIEVV